MGIKISKMFLFYEKVLHSKSVLNKSLPKAIIRPKPYYKIVEIRNLLK